MRNEIPDLTDKLFQAGEFNLANALRKYSLILEAEKHSHRAANRDGQEMSIKHDVIA